MSMWRALLGRRAALLGAALGVAVGLSLYRAGDIPPAGYARTIDAPIDGPTVRGNVRAYLATRGLVVDPLDLTVVEARSAPAGAGRPFAAWFTAGHEQTDLYTLRGRVSATGVPVVVAAPRNLSRTSAGHELMLDVSGQRVLFAVRVDGRIPAVTLLDFGRSGLSGDAPWTTRLAASLSARQTFGRWGVPLRVDVVLSRPTGLAVGRLTGDGFTLSTDDTELSVDVHRGVATPADAAELLLDAPSGQAALGLAADTVRRSPVVGARRVMAVEAAVLGVADWLRHQRHRLFPTAADRVPLATGAPASAGSGRWPPGDLLPGATGLPGEGRWQAVGTQADAADPAAVQTFVRVDPERPSERTHLFAFDMRRLGLHFVAGTRHPRSATGVRGSGRIQTAHRARLVAAFNGGLDAANGRFGAVQDGRLIVRPVRGLATVVTDEDGRAGFGLWDAVDLTPPWTGLRQNMAPLIESGVVQPREVRHWGEPVAGLNAVRSPRSAMGVTGDGVLVYGWSSAISAEGLGAALRRAGVEFAMHLDMGPAQTGLAVYRSDRGAIEARAGTADMDLRPERWLHTEARDFFYVVRSDRRPADLALPDAAPDEGRWRAAHRVDGATAVSSTWLSADRVGARRQVPLLLLEADRLRPHLVPGLAEIRPSSGAPPVGVHLPGPPRLWIDVGLRAEISPYGITAGGRRWRSAQPGLMTLAADASGALHIGRHGEDMAPDRRWVEMLQGPALLVDGEIAEGALGRGTSPASALGRRPDGRWVHAAAPDGDRGVAARALKLAGAVDGILLGERGTATTGSHRLYFTRGERLWVARPPTHEMKHAHLAAGAGTALVFTSRRPQSTARILSTFVEPPATEH